MKTAEPHWERHSVTWLAARSWTRVAEQSHNPLLRPPTRAERVVTRLAAGALIALAFVAAVVCLGVYHNGALAERSESATRLQVPATVQTVADPRLVGNRYLIGTRMTVSYTFAGHARTGPAQTGASRAGSSLKVWVDDSGQLVGAPRTHALTLRDTTLVGLVCLTVLLASGAAGRAGYEAWTIHRHLDDWDAEWLRLDSGTAR